GARDSIENLDQALIILDGQIPIVEGSLVADLEVWKLAVLLIHPTRTREARGFADAILARPAPQPLAVAWCHSAGLKIKIGRIRKCFGDMLRKGQATPSHVVVLALLEAERRGPKQAAQIITQHRHLFPDADAFLSGWQARLEEAPTGDPFERA